MMMVVMRMMMAYNTTKNSSTVVGLSFTMAGDEVAPAPAVAVAVTAVFLDCSESPAGCDGSCCNDCGEISLPLLIPVPVPPTARFWMRTNDVGTNISSPSTKNTPRRPSLTRAAFLEADDPSLFIN